MPDGSRLAKVALSLRDRWRVEERRFECELAWAGFGRLWCDLASCRGATGLLCLVARRAFWRDLFWNGDAHRCREKGIFRVAMRAAGGRETF